MGCTILVADADPLLGEHITDELEVHGFQVMTAVNGTSALKIALGLAPDLIILDLMLPEKAPLLKEQDGGVGYRMWARGLAPVAWRAHTPEVVIEAVFSPPEQYRLSIGQLAYSSK